MNSKLKDRLMDLLFDNNATAADIIAAVQATDEMSAEDRAMVGSVIQVSDDVRFGAKALADQRDNAYAGYILSTSVYKQAHEKFWEFLRNAMPSLDDWEFTYNAEEGKVVILNKRKN
jgi:hypothetical protein